MDRSSTQKINKETQVLNDTLYQMDLIDIYVYSFSIQKQQNTLFSPQNSHGTFSRIDHILSPKSNLVKFRKIKIVLCSLEGLMLKLKLQCFGLLMQRADSFEKTQCWERLREGGEGDDRGWDSWMASPTQWTWVGETLGVGDGQEGLVCCGSWGHKESDRTEWLNWTELEKIRERKPWQTINHFYHGKKKRRPKSRKL